MKEVLSQSKWVGKIITCKVCNRSYQIEAGDEITPGYYAKCVRVEPYFTLLCGHTLLIKDINEKEQELSKI